MLNKIFMSSLLLFAFLFAGCAEQYTHQESVHYTNDFQTVSSAEQPGNLPAALAPLYKPGLKNRIFISTILYAETLEIILFKLQITIGNP